MNDLEAMLNLINPSGSILIDSDLALIGLSDEPNKKDRKTVYIPDIELVKYKVDNSFYPMNSDGEVILKDSIFGCAIIVNGDTVIGYGFIPVEKYKAGDVLSDFFDLESDEKVIILKIGDRLMTNCKSLSHKYDYTDEIQFNGDILSYNGKIYRKATVDKENNIFKLICDI